MRGFRRTYLKTAVVLVGTYLVLWLVLGLVWTTHGINDQDPSFLLALLVHFVSPAIAVLSTFDLGGNEWAVMLGGIVQWGFIALPVAAVIRAVRPPGVTEPGA